MEHKEFSSDSGEWYWWPRQASELYLERQPETAAKTIFYRVTLWLCFKWELWRELTERDEVWE